MEKLTASNNLQKHLKEHKLLYEHSLFPFFKFQELLELSKVNKLFNIMIKNKMLGWKNELSELAKEYNLDLESFSIDETKIKALKNKRKYLVKNTKANYIKIEMEGITYLAGLRGEIWAWYNDTRYWEFKETGESLFEGPTPYLKMVWWLDPRITVPNVKYGKYKFYLRHKIGRGCNMMLQATLKILIVESKEYQINKPYNNLICEAQFINKDMFKEMVAFAKNGTNNLINSFIIDIDLTKILNKNQSIDLVFQFFNIEGTNTCKSDWWCDGVILQEILNTQ